MPAGRQRGTAVVGTGMSLLGLAFCGAYLVVPAVLGLVALCALNVNARRSYKIGL